MNKFSAYTTETGFIRFIIAKNGEEAQAIARTIHPAAFVIKEESKIYTDWREQAVNWTGSIRRDNRFKSAEKQAAKELGVKIRRPLTEVHAVYGASREYAQVFETVCGKYLAISADDDSLSASIFDYLSWEWDVADHANAHRMIRNAAALITI